MPRNLSTAATAYTGPMVWLADLTTRSGARHYFAEDTVTVAGQPYQPYLRIVSGPRFTRTLQADAAEIEFVNTDLVVGALLATEDFEGALCELKQFLVGIDAAVLVFRGLLTEQAESDQAVRFRLVSELDPAQIDLHPRFYAQLCTWRFSQPGKLTPCGYDPNTFNFTQKSDNDIPADIFSPTTIGNSTQSWLANEHTDRIAVITAGTGRGQKRRIQSNTPTTLTLYHQWSTPPDATSKFDIWEVTDGGLPKVLFEPAAGDLVKAANVASPRTIGHSALAMTTDEHKDDLVVITSGPGAGQSRRIQSNTATTLTIADDEPDFNPAPTASSTWMVIYRRCPKDFAPSCEDRARTQAFNGFPTLVPILRRHFGGRFGPGGGLPADRRPRPPLFDPV